jgi:hypothetical protein
MAQPPRILQSVRVDPATHALIASVARDYGFSSGQMTIEVLCKIGLMHIGRLDADQVPIWARPPCRIEHPLARSPRRSRVENTRAAMEATARALGESRDV